MEKGSLVASGGDGHNGLEFALHWHKSNISDDIVDLNAPLSVNTSSYYSDYKPLQNWPFYMAIFATPS